LSSSSPCAFHVRGCFEPTAIKVTCGGGRTGLSSSHDSDGAKWSEWLSAAQRGDGAAYRAFLQAILPYARALARRSAGSDDLAEDIVQDALLTIHRIRDTYTPGRPVKPWLAAIVSRRAIDALRGQGRRRARETHNELAYETFADPRANKEDAASRAELGPLLGELTPDQKEAIELTKLKQMSLAEASAVSGQSIAALKVNVHRAIKKMRAAMNGKEPPGDPPGN
jgi:RNA polymerase sigma-70 factor (ECF subfamily)